VELSSRWPRKQSNATQRIRRDHTARHEPAIHTSSPPPFCGPPAPQSARRTHPPRRFRSAQGMGHWGPQSGSPHLHHLTARLSRAPVSSAPSGSRTSFRSAAAGARSSICSLRRRQRAAAPRTHGAYAREYSTAGTVRMRVVRSLDAAELR